MKILLIFVCVLVFKVCDLQTNLERNQVCTTPNREQAKCISIYDCEGILADIRSGDENRLDFIKQSQCGHDGTPLVCCGSKSYIKPKSRGGSISELSICGLAKDQPRIVGGEVAELDEFPWMAALEYKNKDDGSDGGIRCGGSLITNRYVLTAAHCIFSLEFDLVRAWLGEWDITTDPDCLMTGKGNRDCADKVKKIGIKERILHPLYRRQTGRNDIGLLRLETEVEFTDYILPICLPTQDQPIPGNIRKMFAAGWGATENGTQSNRKLKVELPLVQNAKCNTQRRIINVNQICAGGETGKDSCQGDSGGPLMRFEQGDRVTTVQWFQEGIVSYGQGCGFPFPAVYTRVSRYIEWIQDTMK